MVFRPTSVRGQTRALVRFLPRLDRDRVIQCDRNRIRNRVGFDIGTWQRNGRTARQLPPSGATASSHTNLDDVFHWLFVQ
jgi:hypothetical protein